jgi:hypothetical protein
LRIRSGPICSRIFTEVDGQIKCQLDGLFLSQSGIIKGGHYSLCEKGEACYADYDSLNHNLYPDWSDWHNRSWHKSPRSKLREENEAKPDKVDAVLCNQRDLVDKHFLVLLRMTAIAAAYFSLN